MGNHSFAARNGIFGLLVGLGFIAAALIFYKTGQGISLNPGLNNAIQLLSIMGAFIGVRKYREEGYLPYTKIGDKFFYSDEDIRRFLLSNHYDAFRLPKKN